MASITNSLFRAYREADFVVKFNRERYKELKKAYKEVVNYSFDSKEHNQLWMKYKIFGFSEGLYRILYNNGLLMQLMSIKNKDQIQYH